MRGTGDRRSKEEEGSGLVTPCTGCPSQSPYDEGPAMTDEARSASRRRRVGRAGSSAGGGAGLPLVDLGMVQRSRALAVGVVLVAVTRRFSRSPELPSGDSKGVGGPSEDPPTHGPQDRAAGQR